MKVLFKNESVPLNVKVHVNNKFTDFVVVDSKMNEIHSRDLKGIKILLTVPSVDTRVCSLELSKFINYMQDKDVTLLSISMDLPFALERWCQNNSDKILATSDFRYHDFADMTGLLMENVGLFARSVLILDEHDQVRYLEVVENTHTEPNYSEVLRQLDKLNESR